MRSTFAIILQYPTTSGGNKQLGLGVPFPIHWNMFISRAASFRPFPLIGNVNQHRFPGSSLQARAPAAASRDPPSGRFRPSLPPPSRAVSGTEARLKNILGLHARRMRKDTMGQKANVLLTENEHVNSRQNTSICPYNMPGDQLGRT